MMGATLLNPEQLIIFGQHTGFACQTQPDEIGSQDTLPQ
jgi:hypothetical protein